MVEGEAANRAIAIADVLGVPIYIVHVSCIEAADAIARARARGQRVYGEVLAGHLVIDESVYRDPDFAKAAAHVMSPPFRPKGHQEALWRGLQSGQLHTTATDHCVFCAPQKAAGRNDFTKIPNGGPGVEDRLSLMFDGAMKRGFSLNKWVDITSTASAKMFGMFPKKGTVAVGSDADIVIFDPNVERTISARTHHMNCDYSLFEGWRIRGNPDVVLSRGKVIVENNQYKGRPGDGKFLKRGACATA